MFPEKDFHRRFITSTVSGNRFSLTVLLARPIYNGCSKLLVCLIFLITSSTNSLKKR